jgi:hypothetical protein
MFYVLLFLLVGCFDKPAPAPPSPDLEATEDCQDAKNVCPDYAPMWHTDACPDGKRCVTFKNSCTDPVALAYQIGCNGDGTPGAPQCNCTDGPSIAAGGSVYWEITDGNYTSCLPSWQPACLTAGLAVMGNLNTADCTKGTRLEFTSGNSANPYGKFDSYDIDVEKQFYSVPVTFKPDITCAVDHANHDCRPLFCNSNDCPDAYGTPVSGRCPDGRSPQAGCQDTFNDAKGYTVEFCPSDCTDSSCPSCQDAAPCSE